MGGPQCSPGNLELCDEDKKKQINEFSAKTPAEREEMIKEMDGKITQLEADFKTFVEGLNTQYKETMEKKDKDIEAVKNSGLGLLKSVHAFEKKNSNSELKFKMHKQLQCQQILKCCFSQHFFS